MSENLQIVASNLAAAIVMRPVCTENLIRID